jgi:hypothetical protein
MRQLAAAKNGRCLSDEYINNSSKLQWQCSSGHRWSATPATVREGGWCPECAGVKKKTIEEMRTLAEKRGGKCLSEAYVNAYTPLMWECDKRHTWLAKPNSIQQGQWCPICAGKQKKTLEEMQAIAAGHGGKCLSVNYVSKRQKLKWQCAKGHIWTSSSTAFGTWCPYCAGRTGEFSEYGKIAESKGGLLLSPTYLGAMRNHEWQCAEGHRWLASPNAIKKGSWCQECSKGLSERIVRTHFEQLFTNKFPTCKPKWLTNSRGGRMEFDGFCEALHLAFEYHGAQHFKHNPFFHRSADALDQRISDDSRKRELCQLRGIKLIEIPYTIDAGRLKEFILTEAKKLQVPIPSQAQSIKVNLSAAVSPAKLKKMQELAELHGGRCLSTSYVNAFTKLEWLCNRGHRWWAKPNSIQQGGWCPLCANISRRQSRRPTDGERSSLRAAS